MIHFKTDPAGYAVAIQGDHDDLEEVYDAAWRYLEYYYNGPNPYMANWKGEDIEKQMNLMLSLNYDLRKAFQGQRSHHLEKQMFPVYSEETGEENVENLEFSVSVPLCWFVWLLMQWDQILHNIHSLHWIADMSWPVDELEMSVCRAVMETFVLKAWQYVASYLDADWGMWLALYASSSTRNVFGEEWYAQAMDRILANLESDKLRKAWLAVYIQEMLGKTLRWEYPYTEVNAKARQAGIKRVKAHIREEKQILKDAGEPFLTSYRFNQKFNDFLMLEQPASYDVVYEWLDRTYGYLPDLDGLEDWTWADTSEKEWN